MINLYHGAWFTKLVTSRDFCCFVVSPFSALNTKMCFLGKKVPHCTTLKKKIGTGLEGDIKFDFSYVERN